MQVRNGGKGVKAYAKESGVLEELDVAADVRLKRAAAPQMMACLESLITSRTWRQQQKRAEHALNQNIQFYDKVSKKFLEPAELEGYVRSRTTTASARTRRRRTSSS